MEIYARSTYDYKTIRDFIRFSMLKDDNAKVSIYVISNLMFCAAFVFLAVENALDSLFWICLAIMLFIDVLMIFSYFFMPKIAFKMKNAANSAENEFVFTEEGFMAKSFTKSMEGFSNYKYDSLYRIYETPMYFYLYLSFGSAMIVDKSTLSNEDCRRLNTLLQSRVKSGCYRIKGRTN